MRAPEVATLLRDLYDDDYVWFNFRDAFNNYSCVRLSQDVPSPSCLRDERIGKNIALSYRFKRTHLADWRDIAAGVDTLVASFRKK